MFIRGAEELVQRHTVSRSRAGLMFYQTKFFLYAVRMVDGQFLQADAFNMTFQKNITKQCWRWQSIKTKFAQSVSYTTLYFKTL